MTALVHLAGAFAIRSIIRFGKEAVRVAAEAEEIWNRLAVAFRIFTLQPFSAGQADTSASLMMVI